MNFAILIFFLFLACWLSACRASLRKLTGGLLRTIDKPVQENCQFLHDHRAQYGFIMRATSFFCSAGYILTSYTTFILANDPNIYSFILSLILFLFIREVVGAIWLKGFSTKILHFSCPLLSLLNVILYPYIALVTFIHAQFEARQEDNDDASEKASTEDEILSLVEEEKTIQDEAEKQEMEMIKAVFNLDDTRVREVMTPRTSIKGIEKNTPLLDMFNYFIETGYSRLPVYEDKPDQIVGMVLAKDFINYDRVKTSQLKDMLHSVEFVHEDDTLDNVLPAFRKKKIHLAIVQDEYGGTAGLVTMEDILEEIVGEIQDEFDRDEEIDLMQLEDQSLILNPSTPIEDINKKLDIDIPDDEFDTIGAYIFNITGDIPTTGTIVECDQFKSIILDADERNIISLQMWNKEPADSPR